jgi:hypothetical protein
VKVLEILLDRIVDAEPTAFRFSVDRRLRNDPPFPVPEPPLLFGKLVQTDEWVFANQHKLLFPAVRSETKVVDPLLVVLRFAIDHCVLGLEATLRLVNRLAERASAVLGDADVQRCGAVCYEIPLNPIPRNKELSRFLVTGTAQK